MKVYRANRGVGEGYKYLALSFRFKGPFPEWGIFPSIGKNNTLLEY
jgi:hypothetical protein